MKVILTKSYLHKINCIIMYLLKIYLIYFEHTLMIYHLFYNAIICKSSQVIDYPLNRCIWMEVNIFNLHPSYWVYCKNRPKLEAVEAKWWPPTWMRWNRMGLRLEGWNTYRQSRTILKTGKERYTDFNIASVHMIWV